MNESTIQKAAAQFGEGEPMISPLGDGLIHQTFKVKYESESMPVALQCLNIKAFAQPENIIQNYIMVSEHIANQSEVYVVPMMKTREKKWFYIDEEGNFWRATLFLRVETKLSAETTDEAFQAARCFGTFTRALSNLDVNQLHIIIPGFHDLAYRYDQFEKAISAAGIERLLKSTHVIAELRQRKHLVDFYNAIRKNPAYRTRVMHHDCKMSNILLDAETHEVVCPVDLDTVMPGLYFSDLGDMIRSMTATVDENSTRWEDIDIRKDFYDAVINGYLVGIGGGFTKEEQDHIHHAGLIMMYMQSLRFVTDFLNNDIYYHTTYPEQNLNRALNQLILLEKLEEFLERENIYTTAKALAI